MKHEFVEFLPDNLEEKVIYVSVNFGTVAHKCCCGCGNEVYTPLSPTDWKLTFDGESITLHPSIGNWNFNCKSHYWIRNNEVEWSDAWTDEKIRSGRLHDELKKKRYYEERDSIPESYVNENRKAENILTQDKPTFWSWLKGLFSK